MSSFAQDKTIEALQGEYKTAKEDTVKLRLLCEMSEISEVEDISQYASPAIELAGKLLKQSLAPETKTSVLRFLSQAYNNLGIQQEQQGLFDQVAITNQKSLDISTALGDREGMANSNFNLSLFYRNFDLPKAENYLLESLKLYEATGSKKRIASVYSALGVIYEKKGQSTRALEYYHMAIKLAEELSDKRLIAAAYGDLGSFYTSLEQYEEGLSYDEKSLKLREELKDKYGMSLMYNNIGNIFQYMKQFDKALAYHHKSLKLRQEMGDKTAIAITQNNLGTIVRDMGKEDEALAYFSKSILLFEEIKLDPRIAYPLLNAAAIHLGHNNIALAKQYGLRAMGLARQSRLPADLKNAADIMSKVARAEKNWKLALEMQDLYNTMKDSINGEETRKILIKKQAEFEFEKKSAIEKTEHDKEIAVAALESKRQKVIIAAAVGSLILVCIILVVIFRSLNITRRQKDIIQTQKDEVEFQKGLVEEKQQELVDSINYARRIQNALITGENYIDRQLNRLNRN
ncbi:MAG: tetratricopeptide repeat protein [Bacteroidia bacterium]